MATPIAKFMPKRLIQNFVAFSHDSDPVRTYAVSITPTITDSPSVSGTKSQ